MCLKLHHLKYGLTLLNDTASLVITQASPSPSPSPSVTADSGSSMGIIIGAAAGGGVIVLGGAAAAVYVARSGQSRSRAARAVSPGGKTRALREDVAMAWI